MEENAKALYEEGMEHYLAGRFEPASESWRTAIEVDPGCLEAYEVLGVLLARQGHLDEAIEVCRRLVEKDADYVMGWVNLSRFYLKRGDLAAAEDAQAQSRMISWRRELSERGATIEERPDQDRIRAKIDRFRAIVEADPEDTLSNFVLGNAYVDAREYLRAEECFRRVLEIDPQHTVAHLALGKALVRLAKIRAAIEVFEAGVEVATAQGDLMPGKQMSMQLARLRIDSAS